MSEAANIPRNGRLGGRDLWLYLIAGIALIAAIGLAWLRDRALPREAIAARVSAEQRLSALRLRAQAGDPDALGAYGAALIESGDADGAAEAFARASAAAPRRADLAVAEGEARLMVARNAGAPVPAGARAAFARALAIDPKHARARFFTAALHMADGDARGAVDGWLDLLADTPKDAPEARELRASIIAVAQRTGIDVSERLAQIDAR